MWRGLKQTRGFRSKTKRVLTQFSPHDFTAFKWEGTVSFTHYVTVVVLLAVFLAGELNPFYLKVRFSIHKFACVIKFFQSLLWMEPDHPIIIARLIGVFLCALPAVRELYHYIMTPKLAFVYILCLCLLQERRS